MFVATVTLPGLVNALDQEFATKVDVQAWLDDDSTNFGWLLRGDESTIFTARQFASRENLTVANRPLLTIDFTEVVNGGNQVVITPAINLLLDNN